MSPPRKRSRPVLTVRKSSRDGKSYKLEPNETFLLRTSDTEIRITNLGDKPLYLR